MPTLRPAAAAVCLGGALTAATTYCTCVAAVTACSTACTNLTPALLSAWVPILGIGFTVGCALFYGFDKSALLVMVFLATAAAVVLTIYIASLAVTLGSCQTPRG